MHVMKPWVRELLIALIAMLAVALFFELARAQDEVAPIPGPVTWQTAIQAEMDEANRVSKRLFGLTQTVYVEPGAYDLVGITVPGNVILQAGDGNGIEADLVYVGRGDETVVTVKGGYSTGLRGFRIRTKRQNEPRVVGVKVDDVTNGLAENIRIDLRGVDCVGVQIAGRESLTLRRLEARASVPIRYEWGDNIAFHDCDLGATGNVESGPSCIVHLAGMPHQITCDGSQTWQGGDHAVYGVVDSATTGQGLNLYNVRWEQSTSTNDPAKYAIQIRCVNRAFESLMLVGCRWTNRRAGIRVAYNPEYPLVPKVEKVGGYLPGQ